MAYSHSSVSALHQYHFSILPSINGMRGERSVRSRNTMGRASERKIIMAIITPIIILIVTISTLSLAIALNRHVDKSVNWHERIKDQQEWISSIHRELRVAQKRNQDEIQKLRGEIQDLRNEIQRIRERAVLKVDLRKDPERPNNESDDG